MKKSKSKKCQNGTSLTSDTTSRLKIASEQLNKKTQGRMATGVVVSKKDEKANPKDFTYLKKSEKTPVVAKKVTIKTKK